MAEPSENWVKIEAKVLYYAETYEKARKKLKKAEETSDLCSSDLSDEEEGQRRKRKKSNIALPLFPGEIELSSYASTHIPTPTPHTVTYTSSSPHALTHTISPPLTHVPFTLSHTATPVCNIINSPVPAHTLTQSAVTAHTPTRTSMPAYTLMHTSEPTHTFTHATAHTPTHTPTSQHSRIRALRTSSPFNDITQTHIQTVTLSDLEDTQLHPFNHTTPMHNPNLGEGAVPCQCHEGNKVFQRKVLLMLGNLKAAVQHLEDKIHLMLPQSSKTLPEDCPEFPLQNIDQVHSFNEYLGNKNNFSVLCNYFGCIGGTSVKDIVRRILQSILSNGLALLFNWKGTGGKKLAFSVHENVIKLISTAVRHHLSYEKATEYEIVDSIKKWLVHAKDRNGGRERRKE